MGLFSWLFGGDSARSKVKNLIKGLNNPSEGERERAIRSFDGDWATAQEAIPDLIRQLDDEYGNLCSQAAFALGEIGTPALPALIKALKSGSGRRCSNAALALSTMSENAIPAVKALVSCLEDKRSAEFVAASNVALALAAIGPAAREAVPALIERLQNPRGSGEWESNYIKRNAAFALGKIGKDAKPAIKALNDAIHDPNTDVREAATEAIAIIQVP
jgi:HEAT repeat protein